MVRYGARSGPWVPDWRRENLRTNLWLVPTILTLAAGALFVVTDVIDHAAHRGSITLPAWVTLGGADAGREVLIGAAALVITVAGVVFSVTIVVLTLASQQFGPRMLRNFIRDLGTQVSLGAYVATFVYSVLALGSIGGGGPRPFVPHVSIAVCLALLLVDVVVLIYFIHHIATMIQLPHVIAGIAGDLREAIVVQSSQAPAQAGSDLNSSEFVDLSRKLRDEGRMVSASASGYLQVVRHELLVDIASANDCSIELLYRPGHFVTEGLPLARVWPERAAPQVSAALARSHVAGPHRTLSQDSVFAIDQLVEIAIRALSAAVNDTFTALTCIDWLTDGLCHITRAPSPEGVHRDASGAIRLIELPASYSRTVDRAIDKVRQAGRGMPAILIRQMDGMAKVLSECKTSEQHSVIMRQVEMISRAGADIPEPNDLRALEHRYQRIVRDFGTFRAPKVT